MGMLKDVSENYEMSEVTPVVGVTSDNKFYPIFKIFFSYFLLLQAIWFSELVTLCILRFRKYNYAHIYSYIYYIMDTNGKV